jgi:hypothetical protein
MSTEKRPVQSWPIENLTPYRLNVKKHEKDQVARIAASILKFGWQGSPILVDKDGVIIAGHGRRLAALELGMKTVPVVVAAELTVMQVRALRLADNRAAMGDTDTELLSEELADLDLDLLGDIFDEKELNFMTGDMGAMSEGAFVSDMDAVLEDQKADMEERLEKAAGARVPLAKAFGFKDIEAASQMAITRLMSSAEKSTGLTGEQALVAYLAAIA